MKKTVLTLLISASLSFTALAASQSVNDALEVGDLKAAEQAYRQLSTMEKSSLEGQILSGRLLIENNDTKDAFDLFEQLQKENTEHVDIHYYLGVSAVVMAQKASIFSKLGYAKDFLKAMEKTITLKPDHLDALNTLVGFHLGAPSIAGGDEDKALQYAQQIQHYDGEQGAVQLAKVYWQTENNTLAEQTINKALESYPKSSQLYFSWALAMSQQEKWEVSHQHINKALELAMSDEEKSQALYQQGRLATLSGLHLKQGIESLEQVVLSGDNPHINVEWGQYRLAQLYVKNNQLQLAKKILNEININDDDDNLKSHVKKLNKKVKKQLKG